MNRNEFTPEQLIIVDRNWPENKHPENCTGACQIFGIEITECSTCRWNDGYVPIQDTYKN